MLERLVPAVKDLSLPPLDRLGIENDQFALVNIKQIRILRICQDCFISAL